MAIFISYSHEDKVFAQRLAANLVKERANVWIDAWELNVGDSLLGKIQSAITGASALVVILSRASIQSEWCRKELTAGLMRELSEKRVIVLPALLEDCEIPLFLQDKLYADFRNDFTVGFDKLMEAVAGLTSDSQGRSAGREFYHDWSIGWGDKNGSRFVQIVAVTLPSFEKYSVLTETMIVGNGPASVRYEAFESKGFGWFARHVLIESVLTMVKPDALRFWIEDSMPVVKNFTLRDTSSSREYDLVVTVRRMGEDNGKAVLYDVFSLLECVLGQIKATTRQLTPLETNALMSLIASK
jgi:hypothetical protein